MRTRRKYTGAQGADGAGRSPPPLYGESGGREGRERGVGDAGTVGTTGTARGGR